MIAAEGQNRATLGMMYVKITVVLAMVLYLSITCVMIGGESVVYSSITTVSRNGSDVLACLDSGISHSCKTLGFVLTNTVYTKCTNCTIVVTYDHAMFVASNITYTIDVSSIVRLHVVGLEMPINLDFNGNGITLRNNDNSTTIVLENVTILHCGIFCFVPEGFWNGQITYYLLTFKLQHVVIRGIAGYLGVVAQNIEYHGCLFIDNDYAQLWIQASESYNFNYSIRNCTFKQTRGYLMLALTSYRPSLGTVDIEECAFINVTGFGIKSTIKTSIMSITFSIHKCSFKDSSANFISIDVNDTVTTAITGNINIANNNFSNSGYEAGLINAKYNRNINAHSNCLNHIKLTFINNSFTYNTGILMNLMQWPIFDIKNSIYSNNKGNSYLVSITYDSNNGVCDKNINVNIHNVHFDKNSMTVLSPANKQAIATINTDNQENSMGNIVLSSITFYGNTGTPLSLIGVPIVIKDNVTFHNNNGVTGGGLYIDRDATVKIQDGATVSFIDNNALYGGAIYIDVSQSKCLFDNASTPSFVLHSNMATVGPSIFSSKNWCNYSSNCQLTNASMIASQPTAITINSSNSITVFPGQAIIQDMSAIDCYGQVSSCAANVYLFCGEKYCTSYRLFLQGLPSVYITSATIETGLRIWRNSYKHPSVTPSLLFTCKTPTAILPVTVNVTVNVIECPLGLTFTTSQQCHCLKSENSRFICSDSLGEACVRKGFWYGNVSGVITVSKCLNLFCDYSSKREKCKLDATANYVLLSYSQEEQCLDGHSGTLCTGCSEGRIGTYGLHYCIPHHQCRPWHPYLLLLLNISYPLVIGVLLVLFLQLKFSIGSGYMYGPLFYLAVLDLIPLGTFGKLDDIINFFAATYLLKFRILGLIKWCFFPSVNLLSSMYFELIAPLVVSVVVLMTVYIARCIPRLFRRFQKSPVQAICVLILISFWSLASTSVEILTPTYLSGIEGVRVHLQPDMSYLQGEHILLWTLAVIILLFLLVVTIALILSPFLNLYQIKPLLDEFQSCYKDKFRWYGGVYFCTWIVLQALMQTSNYLILQTIIIMLAAVHFLIQPYCSRWLNVIDGVLLVSLNLTTSLSAQDMNNVDLNGEDNAKKKEVLVYISVIIPLSLIAIGTVGLRLKVAYLINYIYQYLRNVCNRRHTPTEQQSSAESTAATTLTHTSIVIDGLNNERCIEEREPLLQYLSNDYTHINIQTQPND